VNAIQHLPKCISRSEATEFALILLFWTQLGFVDSFPRTIKKNEVLSSLDRSYMLCNMQRIVYEVLWSMKYEVTEIHNNQTDTGIESLGILSTKIWHGDGEYQAYLRHNPQSTTRKIFTPCWSFLLENLHDLLLVHGRFSYPGQRTYLGRYLRSQRLKTKLTIGWRRIELQIN